MDALIGFGGVCGDGLPCAVLGVEGAEDNVVSAALHLHGADGLSADVGQRGEAVLAVLGEARVEVKDDVDEVGVVFGAAPLPRAVERHAGASGVPDEGGEARVADKAHGCAVAVWRAVCPGGVVPAGRFNDEVRALHVVCVASGGAFKGDDKVLRGRRGAGEGEGGGEGEGDHLGRLHGSVKFADFPLCAYTAQAEHT